MTTRVSLPCSTLVHNRLWSQAFLMPSQPTSPSAVPKTSSSPPYSSPPYSLISSVLVVFSSMCMEWMSRYFLS